MPVPLALAVTVTRRAAAGGASGTEVQAELEAASGLVFWRRSLRLNLKLHRGTATGTGIANGSGSQPCPVSDWQPVAGGGEPELEGTASSGVIASVLQFSGALVAAE